MPTRRDFAKSLVAATAALPALAQTPAAATPPSALGKAFTELTRAQYGTHLDADELARIDKNFQDYAALVERFRDFKLANGDEPDFTFASLVDRW